MFLTILDLILILIIFTFIAFGFALGFIQTIGSLIGLVLGAWLAGQYYQIPGEWLSPIFLGNQTTANIIGFILLFTITNRAIGLLFWLINKIFNLLSLIPFVKSFNRLLGACLGLIEGTLALGIVLTFILGMTNSEWLIGIITDSRIANWLANIIQFFLPLLPNF